MRAAPESTPTQAQVTAFTRFVAIDWSGAKGRRHKGIAVAEARAGRRRRAWSGPDHVWSREEVLDWLLREAAKAPTLFGFDFSFAPPLIEKGEYLLGEPDVPKPPATSGPMSMARATTRISAPRASSRPRTAAISISASPTG